MALISLDLAVLVFFKYLHFFSTLAKVDLPLPRLLLPLGISFYAFTAIAYWIDLDRGRAALIRNPLDALLLISFWPHLAAGPILKEKDLISSSVRGGPDGVRDWNLIWVLVLTGLVKKLLIADNLGFWIQYNVNLGLSGMPGWVGLGVLFAFAGQIYCDFSGYSDLAIAFALMMGVRLPANFNYPYRATSFSDFWRRWHISLSTWFRDYLYIPLGGSRFGASRTALATLTVFFLSGLWHGAALNFLVWGGLHGVFLVLERALWPIYSRLAEGCRRWVTLAGVFWAWTYFRFNWSDAQELIHAVTRIERYRWQWTASPYVLLPSLGLGALVVLEHCVLFYRVDDRGYCSSEITWPKSILLMGLFALALVWSGEPLPFIYFKF